jgi:transketolase
MRDSFTAELSLMVESDPKIILITGDLGFGVFDDFIKRYPNNFINAGVAEQNMTGMAAGLAKEGFKVFTYSIGNFATLRCLEQIRNDACYHNLNVNIVSVGAGFSYGPLGMSHHATEDLAIMRALPNVTVFSPGTKAEAKQVTRAAIETDNVSYLRLDKSFAEFDEDEFKLFKASRITNGKDVALISTGGILSEVLKAQTILKEKNIAARVINLHSLKPIDTEEILKAASETKGIITIEEHNIIGGLGSAVAETCMEGSKKLGFFCRMGLKDEYSYVVGDQNHLRKVYGIEAKSIVNKALDLIKNHTS